jgi:hypothetical protein
MRDEPVEGGHGVLEWCGGGDVLTDLLTALPYAGEELARGVEDRLGFLMEDFAITGASAQRQCAGRARLEGADVTVDRA